jgi:SpoVK/Ycf46/Vps4 family AAA+-type ATPase
MSNDNEELNTLLSSAPSRARLPKPRKSRSADKVAVAEEEDENSKPGKLLQWTTPDGNIFIPAGKTVKVLEPGVYDIEESNQWGIYFRKIDVHTHNLIEFPDSRSQKVVREIEHFWERKEMFKDRGEKSSIMYKRGICLWGPPGSGKTCTVQLVVKDVIEKRGGLCVVFGHPKLFLNGMRVLRQIHPHTKIVVLMEDLDSIIEQHDESEVLNILDGVNAFEDVVYLATTNYPERLGPRIINRPSRFDKRIKIGYPNAECRKIYLESLLTEEETKRCKINLDKWVNDTEEFSMAHLKELFVAVVILGDKYDEALTNLKGMKSQISSDESGKMGFGDN